MQLTGVWPSHLERCDKLPPYGYADHADEQPALIRHPYPTAAAVEVTEAEAAVAVAEEGAADTRRDRFVFHRRGLA